MKHIKSYQEYFINENYMYPIVIKREPQYKSYEKEFKLADSWLSLDDLKEYVSGDETFMIDSEEKKIYVSGKRKETPEETKIRVAKEESYMKNYTEYHKNKKRS